MVSTETPPAQTAGLFSSLAMQPADPLLQLIGAYRDDPRPAKIDLGVGVYRTEAGETPVFAAVKQAEAALIAEQHTKAYLGPAGDEEYFARLAPIALGAGFDRGRLAGYQTPGGTGALRQAAELIALARPQARVLIGTPTWANHLPIFAAAGVETLSYDYFDVASQTINFAAMIAAFEAARPGDVLLLHGCCHNPLGADPSADQWAEIARVVAARGLVPLIDLAYQGLGDGLEEDAAGARTVLAAAGEALVAYSCDKNFGLYRDRVGALFAIARDGPSAAIVHSNLLQLARANWSMPPDHGAAVVRLILASPQLTEAWRAELDEVRARIRAMRAAAAPLHPALAALPGQKGMFSTLPLSRDQVARMRAEHGVYMVASGRINIAGLTPANLPAFAAALAEVAGG